MWCDGLDVDEQAKREIKDLLVSFDRSLIAAGSVCCVGLMGRSSSLHLLVLATRSLTDKCWAVFVLWMETMEVLLCAVCLIPFSFLSINST